MPRWITWLDQQRREEYPVQYQVATLTDAPELYLG